MGDEVVFKFDEFYGIEVRSASWMPKDEVWFVSPPTLAKITRITEYAKKFSCSPDFILAHPESYDQVVEKLMELFEIEPDVRIINIGKVSP
jgi:hypothetical protein